MMKVILICLLVGLSLAQTNFNTTCQDDSLIPLLATGTINLNPLDTYNNGANKDYYQSLALAKFAAIDVLGYGFSLTGFQTTCSNPYYTLIIDKVAFENQNTRMRIVVNFRNPGDGTVTLWNLVSFSYIVVSRNFAGTYSDIWASVGEYLNPADGATAAFDTVGIIYQAAATTATNCPIYTDPQYNFGGTCNAAAAIAAGSVVGGKKIIHAYIMGFMWNPQKTTTQYLSGGIIPTTTTAND